MKNATQDWTDFGCFRQTNVQHGNLRRAYQDFFMVFTLAATLTATSAGAQTSTMEGIDVTISNETYIVSGDSLEDIRQELDRRGPRGGWALTAWQVYWNQKCDVRFEATVTLPRVIGLARMPDEARDKIEDMLLALELHEKFHVRTGLFAAEEVKRYSCEDPEKIIDYWVSKNDEFDKETRNGRSEGVSLR